MVPAVMRRNKVNLFAVLIGIALILGCSSGSDRTSSPPESVQDYEEAPDVSPEPEQTNSGETTIEKSDPGPVKTDRKEEDEKSGAERESTSRKSEITERETDKDVPLLLKFGRRVPERLFFQFDDPEPGLRIRFGYRSTDENPRTLGSLEYAVVGTDGRFLWIEQIFRYRDEQKRYRLLVDEEGKVHQVFRIHEEDQSPEQQSVSTSVPGLKLANRKKREGSRTFNDRSYRVYSSVFRLIHEEKNNRINGYSAVGLPFHFPDRDEGLLRIAHEGVQLVLEEIVWDASASVKLPY